MKKIKAIDKVHDQVGGSQEPNMEKKDQLAQKPDDVVESTDPATILQGVEEDHADIQNAQTDNQEQQTNKSKSILRIGPGLITGVADDDPSGIGTYSVAGAMFGYQLLWLGPLLGLLMIAVHES